MMAANCFALSWAFLMPLLTSSMSFIESAA
jgi:hypothetical protein